MVVVTSYRQSSWMCTILAWKCTPLNPSELFLYEKLSCDWQRGVHFYATIILVKELWRYINLISQNKLCNFSGLFMHGRLFIRARKLIPLVTYEVSLIFCTSPQFFFNFELRLHIFLANSRPGLQGKAPLNPVFHYSVLNKDLPTHHFIPLNRDFPLNRMPLNRAFTV